MPVKKTIAFTVSGPFRKWSSPFGKPLCGRREWYVSRPYKRGERNPFKQAEKILGTVVNFDGQPQRYVVQNVYPFTVRRSLQAAAEWLVKDDRKNQCS